MAVRELETPDQRDRFSRVSIDEVRRFWDARPCNIRGSPREVGSRAYFDDLEARKYYVEPHIPRFAQYERWRGKRVLEIGCGLGADSVSFARAGAEVTAVDISQRSVELARRRAELYGLDIRFYVANAEELEQVVPVDRYDLVYAFGVLHHTPHPERAVEQLRRYVGPGSVVKLMLYHRFSWKAVSILATKGRCAFWRLGELVARYSEAQPGCPVTRTYSRKQVRQLLAGFEVTEMWVDHIFPYQINGYVRHQYPKVWPFRLLPPRVMGWLQRRLGWHLCVSARVPE
ncbi:MAG: class I SAM-dependent methyltransferase [Dehalococcoidia bacterium]